jgi:hypothetical protein
MLHSCRIVSLCLVLNKLSSTSAAAHFSLFFSQNIDSEHACVYVRVFCDCVVHAGGIGLTTG